MDNRVSASSGGGGRWLFDRDGDYRHSGEELLNLTLELVFGNVATVNVHDAEIKQTGESGDLRRRVLNKEGIDLQQQLGWAVVGRAMEPNMTREGDLLDRSSEYRRP